MSLTIKKPLLAGNFVPTKAKFPYIATPKIDGIRFLMVNGVAVSRSFKPIRNKYIQNLLSSYLPNGIDGELTSGDTFQSSTSGIMTIEGEPDFKVWIFDNVDSNSNNILPYYLRILNMPAFSVPFQYEVLSGTTIKTQEELLQYEEICLSAGYEGVILRDPMGTYKFGRSTTSENILLKVKRFIDDEAVILDVLEQMSNQNPEEKDAFGHVKRSQSIEGMMPTNTAGTLVVRGSNGIIFDMGSGLNDSLRREIWDNKGEYIGKLVKYKYFPQGIKDKPRHPVFLGFRNEDDL